jgi:hypothetical protein
MTTRRWMMAVAGIALVLAAGICVRRRAAFLIEADRHEWGAVRWDVHQQYLDNGSPVFNLELFDADGILKPPYASEFRSRSEHHAALGRKYRYAASHPWVIVEPDPPEP